MATPKGPPNKARGPRKSDPAALSGEAGSQSASTKPSSAKPSSKTGPDDADPVAYLKQCNEEVRVQAAKVLSAGRDDLESEAGELANAWLALTAAKDAVLYEALHAAGVEDTLIEDAQIEADLLKILLANVMRAGPRDELFAAKTRVLARTVTASMDHDDESRFPKFEAAADKLTGIAKRLRTVHGDIQRQAQIHAIASPQPRYLHLTGLRTNGHHEEEDSMDRTSQRDRDGQGRFISHDDRGYDSRSSRGGDRDEQRHMRDDDDGQRRDSQGRHASQGRGGYGGGGNQGYGSRQGGGQDHGGWYGDSQRHAEAARRGWDERRSHDDGDDDDRRGRQQRGGSYEGSQSRDHQQGQGWHGDSEGHSQASRRGWDERRSHDDEDGRGGRSSQRGSQMSQGRHQGSGSHEGSGWYGDSQGHAQAARRGWDERRSHDEDDDRGSRQQQSSSYSGGQRGGYDEDRRHGDDRNQRRNWDDDDIDEDRRRSYRNR